MRKELRATLEDARNHVAELETHNLDAHPRVSLRWISILPSIAQTSLLIIHEKT
jgi:hypothetical protein